MNAKGERNEEDKAQTARRQKALRVRRKMTIEGISALTGISEGNLRNYEAEDRGVPLKPGNRELLARVFGLTPAQYNAYLAGSLSIDDAIRAGGEPQPVSSARMPKGPILRNHPDWANLCATAMELDRDSPPNERITAEDLRELGVMPFVLAPMDAVTARDVLDLARMVHRHRS